MSSAFHSFRNRQEEDSFQSFRQINIKRRDSESSFQSFKTGNKHEFASFEEHGQIDQSTELKKIDKSVIHKNNLMMGLKSRNWNDAELSFQSALPMPNTHRGGGNLSDCKELHETSHDGRKLKGDRKL